MARGKARAAATGPVEGRWALPDGWIWSRAADFARIIGGSTPKNAADEANFNPAGTPWITPADLSGYSRPTISTGRRNLADHVVKREGLLPAGSVLISSRAPVGYCAVAANPVATNQGFRSLVLNEEIDPFFIRYYVLYSRDYLEENASGTTFKELSGTALGDLLFPLPPLDVQQAIVARIDAFFAEIDDGEAALARARADLATWRKALLKAAVTGALTADWRAANPPTETGAALLARILADRRTRWLADPRNKDKRYVEPEMPDSSSLPELPQEWAWASVGQLAQTTGGVTKNAKRETHLHRLPYLRVGNVYDGRLDLGRVETIGLLESEISRVLLEEGDLLIVEGNGSIDQIGRSAIWTGEITPCVHQNHLIKIRPSMLIFANLIQVWLQSLGGRKELEDKASSTSGLHTLSISKVESLRCPLPPLTEAIEMLARLKSALASHLTGLVANEDILTVSTTLRQSILAAAFRGALLP